MALLGLTCLLVEIEPTFLPLCLYIWLALPLLQHMTAQTVAQAYKTHELPLVGIAMRAAPLRH